MLNGDSLWDVMDGRMLIGGSLWDGRMNDVEWLIGDSLWDVLDGRMLYS